VNREHQYNLHLTWTGNKGEGTRTYTAYERSYDITIHNKPVIRGSSDPSFRGDNTRHNPEEMFVASLSACHMLWYLHLCAEAGIIVINYEDDARGFMKEDNMKGGYFSEVMLAPRVTITDGSKKEKAYELHDRANKLCFIANSCNFPVKHQAIVESIAP
jgi:organic hydroperoxide reductase OsmC/OhrA